MKNTLFALLCMALLTSCSLTDTALVSPASPDVTQQAQESIPNPVPTQENSVDPKPIPQSSGYTLSDVEKHGTSSDCWLVLDGGVYDVTLFIPSHPGGDKILKGCGKDATQMFAKHPESAQAMKEQFKIGDLIQ